MNKKELFNQSLTVILVICAIIITVLVLRREFSSPQTAPQESTVENWQELNFLQLPTTTNAPANPKVQMIKFFDYECPFCKKVEPSVQSVLDRYPNSLSIRYAHYPLGSHQYAYQAAIAAECARNQDRFNEYNNTLFKNQDQIGSLSLIDLAEETKIKDLSTFSHCLENEATKPIVESGMQLARDLKITSIPTFVINGRIISGAISEEELASIIEEELL